MRKGSFLSEPLNTRAEEQSAREMLSNAPDKDALVSIWWRHCESFDGEARNRLSDTFATKLRQFMPTGLSG